MNWYKTSSLLDEIKKFGPNSPFNPNDPEDQERIKFIADKFNIPESQVIKEVRKNMGLMEETYKRHYFTDKYGWSVPTQEAIDKIKEFVSGDKVIEIGSGYGMWAKLMKDSGISIYATDALSSPSAKTYRPRDESFTEVEDLEAVEAILKYSGVNVLMLSWPPYDQPMATNAIKVFKGNKLIFIGEDSGGCTADSEFFEILDKGWNKAGKVDIPRWEGIYDSLTFWTRK